VSASRRDVLVASTHLVVVRALLAAVVLAGRLLVASLAARGRAPTQTQT